MRGQRGQSGRPLTASHSGHCLLWDKAENNPAWTWPLSQEDFTLAVYKHLDETLDHFDVLGVKDWDVINEMVDQGLGKPSTRKSPELSGIFPTLVKPPPPWI